MHMNLNKPVDILLKIVEIFKWFHLYGSVFLLVFSITDFINLSLPSCHLFCNDLTKILKGERKKERRNKSIRKFQNESAYEYF